MSDSPDLRAPDLRAVVGALAGIDVDALSDAERIDLVRDLERLKGAAAAAQARSVVAFDESQRHDDPEGRGVAMQVGLAMRTSHARARRFVGFAHALAELPHTYDALADGRTSEYRAFLVARETMTLTLDDRQAVDLELATRPGGIGALSDHGAETQARVIGQRLDPAAAVRRNSDAVRQRRVTLRAAPDGMCRLSAVLPLTDGVRVHATLAAEADTARAAGDPRARGAVMADELVRRVTATPQTETSEASPDVAVHLVMTDGALLGSDDAEAHHEPAQVVSETGFSGHLPADLARGLVRDAARVWLRRLHTDPTTGELVAMDSRSRFFDGQLRRFLVLRDQTCRTPWCDAPVRHADHVRPWVEGGATTADNGQGLCEACNHAKGRARLAQRTAPDRSVVTTTPTGHTYRSHPPRPPGAPPPAQIDWSALEAWARAQVIT